MCSRRGENTFPTLTCLIFHHFIYIYFVPLLFVPSSLIVSPKVGMASFFFHIIEETNVILKIQVDYFCK